PKQWDKVELCNPIFTDNTGWNTYWKFGACINNIFLYEDSAVGPLAKQVYYGYLGDASPKDIFTDAKKPRAFVISPQGYIALMLNNKLTWPAWLQAYHTSEDQVFQYWTPDGKVHDKTLSYSKTHWGRIGLMVALLVAAVVLTVLTLGALGPTFAAAYAGTMGFWAAVGANVAAAGIATGIGAGVGFFGGFIDWLATCGFKSQSWSSPNVYSFASVSPSKRKLYFSPPSYYDMLALDSFGEPASSASSGVYRSTGNRGYISLPTQTVAASISPPAQGVTLAPAVLRDMGTIEKALSAGGTEAVKGLTKAGFSQTQIIETLLVKQGIKGYDNAVKLFGQPAVSEHMKKFHPGGATEIDPTTNGFKPNPAALKGMGGKLSFGKAFSLYWMQGLAAALTAAQVAGVIMADNFQKCQWGKMIEECKEPRDYVVEADDGSQGDLQITGCHNIRWQARLTATPAPQGTKLSGRTKPQHSQR
ncbi:MAG: hypothetical protein QW343_04425, partial [Candidatus Norongarragalinales archaeon]